MNPLIEITLLAVSKRLKVQPYLVGGPVRDWLLGRPCHDWDLACRHAQKMARAAARKLGGTFIVLDDQYKIYRVVLSDAHEPMTLDFAELQGGSIEKDLSRRDFTVNAMAQRLGSSEIIDPFHGQRDLKRGVIRAVSKKAFTEDPLRLLRAFRFSAQLRISIDSQTLRWIALHAALLSRVAHERVREELLRLLCQPESASVLVSMDRSKLLSVLFPDIESCRRTAVRYYGKGGVLKHLLQTVSNLEWLFDLRSAVAPFSNSEIFEIVQRYIQQPLGGYPRLGWLKLAAFLHDIGKPATAQVIKGRLRFFGHEDVGAQMTQRLIQRLRCSRQETQLLRGWVQHHMRLGNLAATRRTTDKAIARFFRDLGEEGIGMLLVSLADHYGYLVRSQWGKGKDPVERLTARMLESYCLRREKVLPPRLINGHQLMKALKIKPGPMIGKLLEAVQDAQAEGKVKTVEEALKLAKKRLHSSPFKGEVR